MAWTPFSSEAVRLDTELRRLHKQGRTSDALELIKRALESAHRGGPSNQSYEAFEAELETDADKRAELELRETGRTTASAQRK